MDKPNLFPLDYKTETKCPICREYPLTVGNPIICERCEKLTIKAKIETIMKNKKSLLNPKTLVVDALKSKFKDQNIEKFIIVLSLNDDRYSVSLKPKDNEKIITMELDPSDITTIKKMFTTKILKFVENKDRYKAIILQCDFLKEDFQIFLQNLKNEVTLFDDLKTKENAES